MINIEARDQKHNSFAIQSITDKNGELVERLSFDPYSMPPGIGVLANPNTMVELIPAEARSRESRRHNPTDWPFDDVSVNFLFDRGYTGHCLSRFFLDFLVHFY